MRKLFLVLLPLSALSAVSPACFSTPPTDRDDRLRGTEQHIDQTALNSEDRTTTGPQWAVSSTSAVGPSGWVNTRGVALAHDGDIISAGTFRGEVGFGDDTIDRVHNQIYVAKHRAADGGFLWAKTFGGSQGDNLYDVEVDTEGNIFITGTLSLPIVLGDTTLSSRGSIDFFVAKLTSTGEPVWAVSGGGDGYDFVRELSVRDGKVAVTGQATNNTVFGGHSLAGMGKIDAFVALLDSNTGTVLWLKSGGGSQHDRGQAVAIDGLGGLWLVGYFSGTAELFDRGSYTARGDLDVFVAHLDRMGTTTWLAVAGGAREDRPTAITVVGNNEAVFTGFFTDSIRFGTARLKSKGRNGAFVTHVGPSGYIGVARFGRRNTAAGMGIAAAPGARVVVSGSFADTVRFGPHKRESRGDDDVFVASIQLRHTNDGDGGRDDDNGHDDDDEHDGDNNGHDEHDDDNGHDGDDGHDDDDEHDDDNNGHDEHDDDNGHDGDDGHDDDDHHSQPHPLEVIGVHTGGGSQFDTAGHVIVSGTSVFAVGHFTKEARFGADELRGNDMPSGFIWRLQLR